MTHSMLGNKVSYAALRKGTRIFG